MSKEVGDYILSTDKDQVLSALTEKLPDPDTLGNWGSSLIQLYVNTEVGHQDASSLFASMSRKIGSEIGLDMEENQRNRYRDLAKEFRGYAMKIAEIYMG